MRAISVDTAELTADRAVGLVAASDVRGEAGEAILRKGQVVTTGDVERLRRGRQTIHLIAPDPTDLHQDEAGRRLSAAIAGPGLEVKGPTAGQYSLVAREAGLLKVDAETLLRLNCVPNVAIFTLFDDQYVPVGEEVGAAKVVQLVVAASDLEQVETIVRERGAPLSVKPILSRRVGVLVRERLKPKPRARFQHAIQGKLAWFRSEIDLEEIAETDGDSLRALSGQIERGAAVVLIAGGAWGDPLDPAFVALERLGGQLERVGLPAEPGTLFWLGYVGEVAVIGLPMCALLAEAGIVDLIVAKLLAGEHVTNRELAGYGHGGLLKRYMSYRFPPFGHGDG
ncbi:MAG: hypothetical protein HY329_10485 [Chloroflexi bacterium]|nr:hypothetical protein [Chloroflexota bacterium]